MGVSYHIGQHRYRSLLKTLYWFHEFFSTYCLIFLIFQANFQELFLCTLSSFLSSSAYSRLTSVIISPLKFLCSGLSVIFTYQIHLIGNLLASLMILDLPVYPLWLAYETHMLVFILPHTLPYFFFYRLLPSTYPFRQILLYWHWLLLGSQTQFVCTCVCVFSWYWQGVCRFTQFWCHLTGDSTILPRLRAPSYQTTLHFPLQMSFASPRLLLTSYRWEVSTTFRLGLINFLEWFTELGKTLRFTSLIKDIVKNTS